MSLKEFVILSKLGTGSFSQVLKVRRLSDSKEYALKKVKILQQNDKDVQNALNEIRILASIENENIISYKDAFFDYDSSTLCIIMEYADGGDLSNKVEKYFKRGISFRQQEVWKIANELLLGLRALQEKKVLHRDIKSANIFFVNDIAKLGDMNVSKITEYSMAFTQTGTPYYASPQVWRNQPYSYKSDIWSLGCVLYQICSFRPPFRGKNMEELYRKVQKGLFERISMRYSNSLANFIDQCLIVDVKKRASCEYLIEMAKRNNLQRTKLTKNISFDNINNINMIDTIRVPKNIKDLNYMLPRSKYRSPENNHVLQRIQKIQRIEKVYNKQKSILNLFIKKSEKVPQTKGLKLVKSEKYLPYLQNSRQRQPISTKLLPSIPSFKSAIHLQDNYM